jgi:hypothetical protein
VTSILSNCSLSNLDVAYADVKPNVKAIIEYYLRAFRIAAEGRENLAIATTYAPLKGDYERVNFDEVRKLIEKEIEDEGKEGILITGHLHFGEDGTGQGRRLCLYGIGQRRVKGGQAIVARRLLREAGEKQGHRPEGWLFRRMAGVQTDLIDFHRGLSPWFSIST